MLEILSIGFFGLSLVVCLIFDISIIIALLFGWLGFVAYGLAKGYSLHSLYLMSIKGLKSAWPIMIVMLIIGMLTASWRAAGTIAYLVGYAVEWISPQYTLVGAFLLNAFLSSLIGSAFGTSATMGVVTMSMCMAAGVSPVLAGGAILAGCYVGDRCCPISSSALLVASVTNTDIFTNVYLMYKTCVVPFVLAVLIFLGLGFIGEMHEADLNMRALFSKEFALNLWTLAPAVVLLGLLALRTNIKYTMISSIAVAVLVAIGAQDLSFAEVVRALILGFKANNGEVAVMLDGGGLVSMVRVSLIIGISCTYPGIFEGTGLIDILKQLVQRLSARTTSFTVMVLTAVVAAMISCNQILTVLLTNQLCKSIVPDRQDRAIALENSAVIIPPLVPWSIAGAVPIAAVGAPTLCIIAAFYIYLVPLFWILMSFFTEKRLAKAKLADK